MHAQNSIPLCQWIDLCRFGGSNERTNVNNPWHPPASSEARPPRLVPSNASLKETVFLALQRKREPQSGESTRDSRIELACSFGFFIHPDEIAKVTG